jgi:putative ABC transport system permease protein
MLRHSLRVALRSLQRHGAFTLINGVGLAVGMASCALILLYATHELSYDRFHAKADRLFRVQMDRYENGTPVFQSAVTYPVVGPTLTAEMPEVVASARLTYGEGVVAADGPARAEALRVKDAYFADASLLQMFSFPLVAGDAATALIAPGTAVLSETLAGRLFPDVDPVGRTIRRNGTETYRVTGVVADVPATSHLQFDALYAFATLAERWDAVNTSWGWYDFYTYVELAPGADAAALQAKLPAFMERHKGETFRTSGARDALILQPLAAVHLTPGLSWETAVTTSRTTIYFLLVIAGFILLIAWANFINLATARAQERAREIGVRKTVGAERGQLTRQFLGEALLINAAAFAGALLLVEAVLPAFNAFAETTLAFGIVETPGLVAGLAGVFAVGAVLSGAYPAFVLARVRPAAVLRGAWQASGPRAAWVRRGLVVGQFALSIALIVGTAVVARQLDHMQSRDLGFDLEQTIVLRGPSVTDDSTYAATFSAFRQTLTQASAVRSLSATTAVPGEENYWIQRLRSTTMPEEAGQNIYVQAVDAAFVPTLGVRVLAGRAFAEEQGGDAERVLLNATAAQLLGFASPEAAVGARIAWGENGREVAGVLGDYHHAGLQRALQPILYVHQPDAEGQYAYRPGFFALKVEAGRTADAVAAAQAAWRQHFAASPFEHFVLDDFYNRQYQSERRFGQLFGVFAGLAIFIACLGLLGLVTHAVQQRRREISIRKALGASVASITGLLTKDLVVLVAVAALIASPLAYVAMDAWLEGFAYRTTQPPLLFVGAGGVALAIALAAMSVQTLRAARTDPAEVLRSE